MGKLRDNIQAVHRQLEADLTSGDPKAESLAGMLRGELDAARKSLGMQSLPTATDVWIGSLFRAPANGVLILGESTYGEDAPLSEYVPSWCSGAQPDPTFTRIYNAFSGDAPSAANPDKREAFWATIAFSNFVQQPVGPTRVHRPTSDDYRRAAAALPALLQKVKPHGILILGKEQAEFSMPVSLGYGIPCVASRHPTAYGVKTTELKDAWDELRCKISGARA